MIRSILGTTGCGLVLVALVVARSGGQESPQINLSNVRALLASGEYEQAERAARNEVQKLRASHGDAGPEVMEASDVLVRALILNGRGADDQTLALAKRTLAAREPHLGVAHPDLVTSLVNLGDLLVAGAEFQEAIAVTRRAVAIGERHIAFDNFDIEVAESLDHLGRAFSAARRYNDALNALDRSLRIKENGLPSNDVAIARTLEAIGFVHHQQGAYERASVPIRRAAAIQESAAVDHPAYVETLNLVAQQLWFEGRVTDSRTASERAVALAERRLRTDHPTVARSLHFLGSTLADLGELSESVALKERALAIAEHNFGANHHETAGYLHSLAYARLREGNYVVARELFRRALSIFEARYGPWHQEVATSLSMLARTNAFLGDYASARREQARAVTIHERVGGPSHPFVAIALTDLANVYRQENLPTRALPLLDRALVIREKNFGPNHRDVAWTLVDMAATLAKVGQVTRAQALATRAVGTWERLDTPTAPDYATALALYAELQSRRGNYMAAQEYFSRAMAIRERVFGTSNPSYADAQAGLALALAKVGDRASALVTAVGAETTGREHLRVMLRTLPERQSLDYAAVRPRGLDLILSLAESSPEAAVPAMDGLIRSRALVLDEMAARQTSRRTTLERTDPLWVAFASAQQRLANLIVRGPDQLPPVQYATVLEDARRETETAEQALAERSAEFRTERNRAQLGLEEVRAALPIDGALVSFVRYERTLFSDPVKNAASKGAARFSSRTVPSYLALVLRAHQVPAVVPLGSVQTIDSLVSQWRADIAAEGLASTQPQSGGSVRSSRLSGAALRRLIWDPVAPELRDASQVFIVPDGTLSLVPFVALPVGARTYLIERAPVVHYLSAERDLVATVTNAPQVGQGLLALGGPAFDDSTLFGVERTRSVPAAGPPAQSTAVVRSAGPTCETVQGIKFSPLAGTLQEVRELSGMWSTSPVSTDGKSRVLVGRDASEPTFKKEARGYRVLHLATHGFFLGDACAPVRAGTRSVGGLVNASGSQSAAPRAENPLLLSGLALAGANRRQIASPVEDDGILTAEEVASLDLGGVEWAVLSACDTGVGQIKTGEGVFGLRRAFQVAGARTVIMSLWSVDDQATRVWMRTLYEGRFQKQLTTADAVHAASVAALQNRRAKGQSTNPFYWAAFVAVGSWK